MWKYGGKIKAPLYGYMETRIFKTKSVSPQTVCAKSEISANGACKVRRFLFRGNREIHALNASAPAKQSRVK